MKPDAQAVLNLRKAAQTNDVTGVKEYIATYGSEAVDEDADSGTALFWAVWRGHVDVVSLLLAHNADIHTRYSQDNITPLQIANDGARKMSPNPEIRAITDMLNERAKHLPSEEESHDIRMTRKATEAVLAKPIHAPKFTLKRNK